MGERSRRASGADAEGRDLLGPGLVHELRRPLMALDAALRLLARDLGPSVTGRDAWTLATGQVARIQETLETFQQLLAGTGERGSFSVEPVVRRALAVTRARLDGLGERFALLIDRDVPRAHGDALALLHALVNVVGNALDAVEEGGGGRVQVRVLRAAGAGRAQVRVSDEGIGILSADRERIFAPGYTTKPRGKGSGLGLALSRRMLRRAGGELRLADVDDPARARWAQTELVLELADPAGVAAPQVAPAAVARRRRRLAWSAGAAAAITLAIAGGVAASRAAAPSPAAPPVAAEERGEEVVLERAAGPVERLGAEGWEPISPGLRLLEADTIRTGASASATLALGEGSRVTVSDATQLTVREITVAAQRLRLSRGRISVDHQPDGTRVMVVESQDGGSVARAGAARFDVLASGGGFAVASARGVVRLAAGGEEVEIAAGRQAVSFRGEPPDPAAPVPVGVLLKIARTAMGEGVCTVDGVAQRGAEVRVDGQLVEVRRDGRFSVRLAARHGLHASVVTRDVAGRVAERRVACKPVPREEDLSDFAVRWGPDGAPRRR